MQVQLRTTQPKRDWQWTRTFKFPDFEIGIVFKDNNFHLVCNVERNVVDMDALSLNYWLAKFRQIRRATAFTNVVWCRMQSITLKRHLGIYRKD